MNAARFGFGKNWQSFSRTALSPERVALFRRSFAELVRDVDLRGKRFLDVGFGQGLALTAAREMGAEAEGVDVDADNLEALKTTARAMGHEEPPPARIVSILDEKFVREEAGRWDVVHSWGVLHHTGAMRLAIENACRLVAEDGFFICAIYNRHWSSPGWKVVKWTYNRLPGFARRLTVQAFRPVIYVAKWIATGRRPRQKARGMDFMHDVVDWVGGYPYEYASAEEIVRLVEGFGFRNLRLHPPEAPTGCNEFVFVRETPQ